MAIRQNLIGIELDVVSEQYEKMKKECGGKLQEYNCS